MAEWTPFLKLGCLRIHISSWMIEPPAASVWTLINPLACSLLHSHPTFQPPDPFAVFPTRFLVTEDLLSDLISIWPIKCRFIPWVSQSESLIWFDKFEHTFIWVLYTGTWWDFQFGHFYWLYVLSLHFEIQPQCSCLKVLWPQTETAFDLAHWQFHLVAIASREGTQA